MNRVIILAASLVVLAAIQGCATKTYGRQDNLTSYEKNSMSCLEIDLDLIKTRGFVDDVIDHVNMESEFSGRDVSAILGDFGIGNSLEKSAALENASQRIEQLGDLLDTKKCSANHA
jgi:hypothetical protein